MPDFRYKARVGNVPSYQISSIPFASASIFIAHPTMQDPVQVQFPNVTRFVTVVNNTSGSEETLLRVGFSARGASGGENAVSERPQGTVPSGAKNNYYFTLKNGESYTADWRVTSVYLSADPENRPARIITGSVIAGCTGIDYRELSTNWSGTVGVG
jgi:hypothetical protein